MIEKIKIEYRRAGMNKKQKLVYLTDESIEKLKLLQQINGLDQSKIIDILIKKQKKLNLI